MADDLREARIRRAKRALRALFEDNPRLGERVEALGADAVVSAALGEDDVAQEVQVSLRLPAGTPERAEALAEVLAEQPERAAYRVTRASVLREALLRGLAEMEADAGVGKGKRRTRK